MGMGEALGMIFSGAAGEYAGNRANQIRSEDAARLAEAREQRMAELQQKYAVENREDQQAYGTAEREAQQKYNTSERLGSQEFQSGEAEKGRQFTAGQNTLARQHSEKLANMKAGGVNKGENAEGEPNYEQQWTKNDQGQWGRVDVYANGTKHWVAAPKITAEMLNNREEALASAGKPSEGEILVDRLLAKPDVGVGTMRALADMSETGKGLYEAGQVLRSGEDKKAFNDQKRLNGLLLQGGVAAAKALGASGINTASEAKMYFESMPKLDYSSEDNYKASLNEIKRYIQSEKKGAGMRLGVPEEAYSYMRKTQQPGEPEKATAGVGANLPAYTPAHEAAAAPAATGLKKYW